MMLAAASRVTDAAAVAATAITAATAASGKIKKGSERAHSEACEHVRERVVNKAGRPVVDALAKELVEDIFKWDDIPAEPFGGELPITTLSKTQFNTGGRSVSPTSDMAPAAKVPRVSEPSDE